MVISFKNYSNLTEININYPSTNSATTRTLPSVLKIALLNVIDLLIFFQNNCKWPLMTPILQLGQLEANLTACPDDSNLCRDQKGGTESDTYIVKLGDSPKKAQDP